MNQNQEVSKWKDLLDNGPVANVINTLILDKGIKYQ